VRLPANPLPCDLALAGAQIIPMRIEGGAMEAMRRASYQGKMLDVQALAAQGKVWSLNGILGMPGKQRAHVAKGRTAVTDMIHRTTWSYAMHLHWHHFQVAERNSNTDKGEPWRDTVMVAPGVPHHVTQRGNRRQTTFFSDADYATCLDLLAEQLAAAAVALWAFCLMPNHVHLILVPKTEDSLAGALGEAHRRYTRRVNSREGWREFLRQGRFASFQLQGDHLLAAARYVELNPVRAKLVARPEDWPWSSARGHLAGRDGRALSVGPLLVAVGDWRAFLDGGLDEEALEALRRHERAGRPLGSTAFIERLEGVLGRQLRKGNPGPKTATD
jgi:putative transposase